MGDEQMPGTGLNRRRFLKLSAAIAAVPAIAAAANVEALAAAAAPAGRAVANRGRRASAASLAEAEAQHGLQEATIAQLQARMGSGRITSRSLTEAYLQRIHFLDNAGPTINSVMELNPDARRIAQQLDDERRAGHIRGPLHGIPVLLKDNIDTGDKMQTTAGSFALVGDPAPMDSTVAKRLRAAGAVILGKANLSEWANIRGVQSSSGWSGRGGQTRNPYIVDRNPCGSSSGSAAAVSANFVTVALGTETDGSIVCPANNCGIVGIKPTVGLTSRAGVVPISHSQDTVGPHGRTVADAATVLGALVGVDPRDAATQKSAGHFHHDYRPFLDPNGLHGARIGVARQGVTGYSPETDALFETAIQAMRDAGAHIVDPADIPTIDEIGAGADETVVLFYELKRDLRKYLTGRTGVPIHTLADAIAFNNAHADQELKWFGQELFEFAESDPFTKSDYQAALPHQRKLGGHDGIDAVLQAHNLDALVAPTGSPAWPTDLVNGDLFLGASSSPAAIAGYPMINVPMGLTFGLPVGISFIGTAWSEPTLIKLACGFEHVTRARQRPEFLATLPGSGGLGAGGGTAGAARRIRSVNPAAPRRSPHAFSGRL